MADPPTPGLPLAPPPAGTAEPVAGSEPAASADGRDREADTEAAIGDEAVVERVLAGDRASFELLMRRHNSRVFRAVRSIVRTDDEAEDVMQDAYVRAFEHLERFEKRARFSTWLTRIAIHEAISRVRRQKRVTPLDATDEEPSMPSPTSTPEERSFDRELRELLEHAIAELPVEFRTVFVLRAVEQMPAIDVAECLDIPVQTVKTRFFRARQRLRALLLSRAEARAETVFEFHLSRCDRVVTRVLNRLAERGV
ncbi:MAG TPA: RNA polymerase sigma factor [Polyangiaceae bacterium]|nr:RNA polymerase sigma factor [Polyangiaceae bacterium]